IAAHPTPLVVEPSHSSVTLWRHWLYKRSDRASLLPLARTAFLAAHHRSALRGALLGCLLPALTPVISSGQNLRWYCRGRDCWHIVARPTLNHSGECPLTAYRFTCDRACGLHPSQNSHAKASKHVTFFVSAL